MSIKNKLFPYMFFQIFLCSSILAAAALSDSPASQNNVNSEGVPASTGASHYSYRIIKKYSHDTGAFTQGLFFADNALYEGTGLKGKSEVRKINIETGRVLKVFKLPDSYYGEGLAGFGDRMIQLTWKSRTGFVYDRDSFQIIKTFRYFSEGWGLTYDGQRLIMSDGSANLYFLDPETFKRTGHINVHYRKMPIMNLNELEYVRGMIYANIWKTDIIAVIDPDTGRITGWINLEQLTRQSGGDREIKTLNGIAYDSKNDRLFVTGKLWPYLYEIKLVPLD
jgi:glutamine cyclotransferase